MKKNDFRKKNRTMQYIIMALCGILCVCAGAELATQDWMSAIADFIFLSATTLFLLNTRLFDEYIDNSQEAVDLTLMLLKDVIKSVEDYKIEEKDKEEK